MPNNYAPKDRHNPFADYTVEQLYAFLSGHTLTRDIGAQYDYSNIGVGLLGHALARRLGTDFETAIKERITGRLGMRDTVIQLTRDQQKRLAHGHDEDGHPVSNWDLKEAFAGAGALRSTANDLLAFLAVVLGYQDGPLKPAMDAQLASPMRPASDEWAEAEGFEVSVGLGWHALENKRGRVVMHGGGTGGYLTFMGLNLERGWGAVVLTNMFRRPAADIGIPIFTGAPLGPAPNGGERSRLSHRFWTDTSVAIASCAGLDRAGSRSRNGMAAWSRTWRAWAKRRSTPPAPPHSSGGSPRPSSRSRPTLVAAPSHW